MIKGIQIERFKGLRQTPILELGKINLLTGANGRGKSSLCQVILTLAQTWDAEATNALLPNGKWVKLGYYDDIHYVFDKDSTIKFHIVTNNAKDNDFEIVYDKSETKNTLIELVNVAVDGKSILDGSGNSMADSNSDFSSDFNIRLSRLSDYPSLTALRNIHYIGANRIAASYREELDENATKLFSDGSNVLSVLWNHRDQGCVKEVEDLMSSILDGAEIHIESSANELVFTLNSAKDTKLFRPINVGYGHSFILSAITALVIAKENDTLIVENPEAHLHPAAQAKLMKVIIDYAIKKNVQVFVETHSDHVLNTTLLAVKRNDYNLSADDVQVLFFSGDEGKDQHFESIVTNLEVTSEGHILNPPLQFFEQYAIDLRNLYSSRRERHSEGRINE